KYRFQDAIREGLQPLHQSPGRIMVLLMVCSVMRQNNSGHIENNQGENRTTGGQGNGNPIIIFIKTKNIIKIGTQVSRTDAYKNETDHSESFLATDQFI